MYVTPSFPPSQSMWEHAGNTVYLLMLVFFFTFSTLFCSATWVGLVRDKINMGNHHFQMFDHF